MQTEKIKKILQLNRHPFFFPELSLGLLILLIIGIATPTTLALRFYTERDTKSSEIIALQTRIASLEDTLTQTRDLLESEVTRSTGLATDLEYEQRRNQAFEDQISDITGVVGDLDKLSKTDEELLMKYSKVYFLNENYEPESLRQIDAEWKYNEDKDLQLHSDVMPFLEDMLEDAQDDDIKLWIVSAFRSFGQQATLKNGYVITYGSGANAFSADQGYSEHQLGTTLDFTTEGLGGGLRGFGDTEAYQWMQENAYKYGFILSYPDRNSYYEYEPWHWRFVGRDLAKDLHRAGDIFYDWEQRKIDEYLISIFD